MSSVLENYLVYGFSEVCEVVKTALVMKGERLYRVEVERSYTNSEMPYGASCWIEEERNGRSVWIRLPLPWAAGTDPDEVLTQAFGFLAGE